MIRVILWRSILLVCFVLLVQLAYACFQIADLATPYSQSHKAKLYWNPFSDTAAERFSKLENSSAESMRRLGFMTFSKERQQEAAVLVRTLREQINISPYNVQRWGLLVDMEAESKQKPSERIWAMETAFKLGRWNNKYRLAISSYCLDESLALLKYDAQLCRQLLSTLPHNKVQHNAHGMGVNYKYLKARLEEINDEYGLGQTQGRPQGR